MTPNNNTSIWLDLWDAPEVTLPEKSRLYHLEPVGVGTPYVESLTSYLSRLAAAHHVTISSLVRKEIQPVLPEGSNSPGTIRAALTSGYARALNGSEKVAKNWANALESLTLREDLFLLNMSRWSEVLTPTEVIRHTRAWCPSCYQEWLTEGKKIYEPLIWFIKPVQICMHHGRALAHLCPFCSRSLPALTSHYRAGYCSRCMKWLGASHNDTYYNDNANQNVGYVWQQWVSKNAGELLSLPAAFPRPDKRIASRVLQSLLARAPRQSLCGLSEWLHLPYYNVRGWHAGEIFPQFPALLCLCYRLGITLVEFFSKDFIVDDLELPLPHTEIIYETKKKKDLDHVFIRRVLEETISSEEEPPPSMLAVSRRLSMDHRDLRRMFPELCKSISEKFRHYMKITGMRSIELICKDVRRISHELHKEGLDPTRLRVSLRMKKSAYFRMNQVQNALKVIRRELGYEN